jgi:hypothetical protein
LLRHPEECADDPSDEPIRQACLESPTVGGLSALGTLRRTFCSSRYAFFVKRRLDAIQTHLKIIRSSIHL